MSLDQEQYEKLEAYVGGDLDSAGRAEVEKLLAGNPQLRKLLAELLATRDMVRTLPRASAPADLLETFQGQIERAELFGDVGPDEKDVVLKISRWPQYMSVAAVVFLALGLAGIIYKVVLPRNRANSGFVLGPSGDVGDEEKKPATSPARHMESEKSEPSSLAATSDAAKLSVPMPSVALHADTRPQVSVADLERAKKDLASGTALAENTPEEPIVMVVRSDNPQAANAQVRSYFGTNSIAFDTTTEALARDMLRTRDAKDESLTLNYADTKAANTESTVNRQRNPVARGATNQQEMPQNLERQRTADAATLTTSQAAAPAQTQASEPADMGRRAFGGGQRAASGNNESAGNYAYNSNATTSQGAQNSLQQGIGNSNSFRGVFNSTQPAAPNPLDAAVALGANPSGGNVYRAMLTQRQIRELNTRLQSQGNQWTEIHGGSPSDAMEQNALTGALNAPTFGEAAGQRAKLADGFFKKSTTPATQATGLESLSKVEDGIIGGRSPAAADRLATTQPTPFHVATSQPATAPATQFSTGAFAAKTATLEPEDRHEVVIVVNEQPIDAPSGSVPATQPAGAAAQPATAPAGK